jgi:hypothetical protein
MPKTIKFFSGSAGLEPVADGDDGLVLPAVQGTGVYPQTLSGQTVGWSPNNDPAISASDLHGAVAPFQFASVRVNAGSADRLRRIDGPAGTYEGVKLQTFMTGATYLSTALRVLDSDGTTVLWSQNGGTVVSRNNEGLGDRQLNTDGSMVAVGTADPGATFETTGGAWYVQLRGLGQFANRLTVVEYTPPAGAPAGNFAQYYVSQLRTAGLI